MAFMILGMWWLVVLVIVLVFLSIYWDRTRLHKIRMYHKDISEKTVQGTFSSDQDGILSQITYLSKGVYIRHIQGTPTSQNQTWTQDPSNPTLYTISKYVYAEWVDGDIHIMDLTFSPTVSITTLTRVPLECPVLQTPVPTLNNVNQYYDLVYVEPPEYQNMKELLDEKKGCAMINDWSFHQTSEKLEEGIFALDKKKTCFFYVMPHLVYLYAGTEHTPKPIKVSELTHGSLLFGGVAIV